MSLKPILVMPDWGMLVTTSSNAQIDFFHALCIAAVVSCGIVATTLGSEGFGWDKLMRMQQYEFFCTNNPMKFHFLGRCHLRIRALIWQNLLTYPVSIHFDHFRGFVVAFAFGLDSPKM